jgi:hypothetical protein
MITEDNKEVKENGDGKTVKGADGHGRIGLIAQEQCEAISLELIYLPSLCGPVHSHRVSETIQSHSLEIATPESIRLGCSKMNLPRNLPRSDYIISKTFHRDWYRNCCTDGSVQKHCSTCDPAVRNWLGNHWHAHLKRYNASESTVLPAAGSCPRLRQAIPYRTHKLSRAKTLLPPSACERRSYIKRPA